MSYIDFTLNRVNKAFDLTLSDKVELFADAPELECSDALTETLRDNVPLGNERQKKHKRYYSGKQKFHTLKMQLLINQKSKEVICTA